jgi:hypothetical protein
MTMISFRPAVSQVKFGNEASTVSNALNSLKEAVNAATTSYSGALPGYAQGFSVNGRSLKLKDGRGMSTIETTTASGQTIVITKSFGGPYSGVTLNVGGKDYTSNSSQDAATFDAIAAQLRGKVPSSKPKPQDPDITF